ncbi:anti-sigma factor [Sphingomonas sp.]|uniref:anti-sigma factor n=1 Tax=Sphingomonas sp. TaxID=28214 RepID=UPI0025CCD2C7|nr:anti-sigma factor [Sphingomonas sp.]
MSSTPLPPEDRAALAAEYALGLLEGEELAHALELEQLDRAFREDVDRWNLRLAPILDGVMPVTPPAATFAAIERRIRAADPANDNFILLRQHLNRWRALAGGATALAASLALALLIRPTPETSPQVTQTAPLVAMIEGNQGDAQLVAMWNKDERKLTIFAARVPPVDPQHSHELWIIPADGKPRSVGVLPGQIVRVAVDTELAEKLSAGVTLAVSLEPAGGSPTGAPTGPVLASGKLRQT